MSEAATPFIIGWEEWLALPELGLPAIKAKVDTGARTSALHAFLIETFGPASAPMVRFGIHPIPGREDIEIYCSAPIVDRREVTSSNGERETRHVIRTRVEMGARSWEIEIGLTNRESMAYRMLLGRQAIREDMFVDPASSFRQPRLSYRLYRHMPRHDLVRRALRMAVLTRRPDSPSNRRLIAAAEARGHVLEAVDTAALALGFDGPGPIVRGPDGPLAHYDAVIPRLGVGEGPIGGAFVRQLELMGSYAVNSGDALDRRANPLALVQALARAGIAHCLPGSDGRAESSGARPEAPARHLRFLVIGGRVAAVLRHRNGRDLDAGGRRLRAERALAERAAGALSLGLAAVHVDPMGETPCVCAISARPDLGRYERITGARVSEEVIALIEQRVRSWVQREEPAADPGGDGENGARGA